MSDLKKGKGMATMSICLSDLPKEKMVKAGEKQKIYIPLTIWFNEEPDKYDNDFSVCVSKTKEEREAGKETIYVGNGKFQEKKAAEPINTEDADDLPF